MTTQDTTMSPALALEIAVAVERTRRRVDVPVPEKWCVDCKRMRPRGLFEGRRKTCIDCAPTARDRSGEREATARYREKNYAVMKEKQLAKAHEHATWMDMLKVGPCTDCGALYPPYVMDWDHVRGNKAFNLGLLRAKYSYKNVREWVLAEIAKCDLVCSNCHRERTHQRAQEARAS